ncbi:MULTISPECIES: Cof-type HAD-IIB family hydrolase [Lactobacillus]|uniref:Cof-type HAD-IIB family hydrolase n=1 Tax=Lactobacillus TaxID=1578 RepID=UPI000D6ED17B|nr:MULTISPECIES: Cof-type HAD-IIB family hydrolase [Lactobacillus]AWN33240.1 Cof-type HAD-IIB family hydrolase [Lactobacillus helsingborgensis]RMC53704.1 HAD family phosphatase [Lactobacillus sp. ESL0262]
MIKLVACDLDGTLFNSNMTISEENAAAIKLAQKNGIEFLVATGRSPQQSRKNMREYGLKTGFININGALVYDANEQLQVKHQLPNEKAKLVAHILLKNQLYFELVTADKIYSNDISKRVVNLARSLMSLNPGVTFKKAVATAAGSNAMLSMTLVEDFDQLLADPKTEIMKIISFDAHGPSAFSSAKKEIMSLGDVAVTSSAAANIEINDIKAQKGPALLDYARKKGFKKEEVAAIGDNLNDASMIRDAGVGVAMANAVPAIKKLAQVKTKSNDDNGVAYILKKFIKNNAEE